MRKLVSCARCGWGFEPKRGAVGLEEELCAPCLAHALDRSDELWERELAGRRTLALAVLAVLALTAAVCSAWFFGSDDTPAHPEVRGFHAIEDGE